MKPIIEVKNISKKYRIGIKQPYYSLRDTLVSAITHPFSSFKPRKSKEDRLSEDEFWALKDINFSVEQGEVLGIIGRNGAGKSTLLKILSQITPPTYGEITLRGRVASLLEVGTGFHPELTGRENIFLNGSILGMTQKEIKRKFDEIVDFAEIEKFLDTPVKRYSSGMYMRLAFAVAAHLEPEILIVDEVLAVGDTEFQKKCLGKMESVSKQGRTVLFVSHNMNAIRNICQNTILLKEGRFDRKDKSDKVVDEYLSLKTNSSNIILDKRKDRKGMGKVKFTDIKIGQACSGNRFVIEIKYKSLEKIDLKNSRIGLGINDRNGTRLFVCSTELFSEKVKLSEPDGYISCSIERLPLTAGNYSIDLFFEVDKEIEDWIDNAIIFSVTDGNFFPTKKQCPVGYEGRYVLVSHRFKF